MMPFAHPFSISINFQKERKMYRRELLKRGVALAGLATFSKFAIASTNRKGAKPLKVSFAAGVHSAALPNGSWNLWVRAAPSDINNSIVRLKLQVATDEAFSNIIDQQNHVARREAHYILRTIFMTRSDATPLYFRFIALQTGTESRPHHLQASSTGTLVPLAENG